MRKTLALLISATVATGAFALPALAGGGKKTLKDSVSLTAAPFPNAAGACTDGVEGVHKVSTPLHVPGKGKLTANVSGFTGDWNLYVLNGVGSVLAKADSQQAPGAATAKEALSVSFKKMADIEIVACNFAGTPQATLNYKLVYTAAKTHHHH